MSGHPPQPQPSELLNEFLSSINTDRLCAAASILKPEAACRLGAKIVGGYNVLFEIVFDDGITWLARCPLPYASSSQDVADNLLQSYAAALRYIKLNTIIPVPEVFACCRKSEKGNDIGTSYMLMERLVGHPIDIQDVEEDEEGYEFARDSAKKVFKQVANFIIQLASLQFNKIGSLYERPTGSGTFYVGEYFDAGIVYPPQRGQIYEASITKGPFSTVREFHSAMLSLNLKYAALDEVEDYLLAVQQCHLLQPKLSLIQYENGPFVLHHDDLSSSNLLVDDDYNITGVLDFPGTIVPLPSLCVYPMIFSENYISPFTERKLWLECLLNAHPFPSSALNDVESRKVLMENAMDRGLFDNALSHTYAYIAVESLAEKFGIQECEAEEQVDEQLKGNGVGSPDQVSSDPRN